MLYWDLLSDEHKRSSYCDDYPSDLTARIIDYLLRYDYQDTRIDLHRLRKHFVHGLHYSPLMRLHAAAKVTVPVRPELKTKTFIRL